MKRLTKLFTLTMIAMLVFTGCTGGEKKEETSTVQTQEGEKNEKIEEDKKEESSDKMKDNNLEEMKDKKPEEMKDKKPEEMKDKKPEEMKDKKPEEMKDEKPEEMKDKKPEEMKDKKPEEMKDKKKEESKVKEEPKSKYKDGTYTGSSHGYAGDITVSVTISGDKITDVNVTNTTDDEPYISQAKEITASIISNQSADVSAVAGATKSSNGIINAARNAIDKAKNQ